MGFKMLFSYIGFLAAFLAAANSQCSFPSRWWGKKLYGHLSNHFQTFLWSFHDDNPSSSVFHSHNLITTVQCLQQYGPFYLLHEVTKGGYWCLKEQQVSFEVTVIRVKFHHKRDELNPPMCKVCQCSDEAFGYLTLYPDDELMGLGEPLKCMFPHLHHVLGHEPVHGQYPSNHHYSNHMVDTNHTEIPGEDYDPGYAHKYIPHRGEHEGNDTYGDFGEYWVNMTHGNYSGETAHDGFDEHHDDYKAGSHLESIVDHYVESIMSDSHYKDREYHAGNLSDSGFSIGNMSDDDLDTLVDQYVSNYLSFHKTPQDYNMFDHKVYEITHMPHDAHYHDMGIGNMDHSNYAGSLDIAYGHQEHEKYNGSDKGNPNHSYLENEETPADPAVVT